MAGLGMQAQPARLAQPEDGDHAGAGGDAGDSRLRQPDRRDRRQRQGRQHHARLGRHRCCSCRPGSPTRRCRFDRLGMKARWSFEGKDQLLRRRRQHGFRAGRADRLAVGHATCCRWSACRARRSARSTSRASSTALKLNRIGDYLPLQTPPAPARLAGRRARRRHRCTTSRCACAATCRSSRSAPPAPPSARAASSAWPGASTTAS